MSNPRQFSRKNLFVVLTVSLLVLIIFLVLLFPALKRSNHRTDAKLLTASVKLATQDNYNGAAEQLIQLYKKQSVSLPKASTARQIGLNYYYAHDYQNGKKWLKISTDLYKILNKSDVASQVTRDIDMFEAIKDLPNTPTEKAGDSEL